MKSFLSFLGLLVFATSFSQLIVKQRSSGPSPLGLHFSIRDTFQFSTIEKYDFEWRYPDNSVDVGNQSVKTFTQSGWVKLKATHLNQSVIIDSTYITVQNPNTIYNGTLTTCLSTSGNFAGCPVGAAQITITNLNTQTFAANNRYLLRQGETFTLSALKGVGLKTLISSYGANISNKPTIIVSGTPTSDFLSLGDSSMVEHINFQGYEWVLAPSWSGNEYGEGRLFLPNKFNTLYDLTVSNMNTFCVSDDNSGYKPNLIIDSVNINKLGSYFLYSGPAPSISYCGVKNTTVNFVASQHGIRFNGGKYLCVQGFKCDSVDRSHITLRSIKHALIKQSEFTGKALYKCSIRNVSNDNSLLDTVRYVIYEGNKFSCNPNEFGIDMGIGEDVIIRNNLFLNASLNVNTNLGGFLIKRVNMYHNTFYLDNFGFYSAINIRSVITGNFRNNVVLVNNCTTSGCFQENPFASTSSQNPSNLIVNHNCYYVNGDPTGANFKGTTSFTNWKALGLDVNGLYGTMTFSNTTSNIVTANFTPLPATLPTNLTPYFTHRDITNKKRNHLTTNTAGAYELNLSTTGISNLKENEAITLYPNPTTGVLYISDKSTNPIFELYDYTGKLVKRYAASNGVVDISEFTNGIYLLKSTKSNACYKVIKQ